jgi:hypothetical protein
MIDRITEQPFCQTRVNTHGNKESTNIITETLGVNPISINSKLVSAQNRPRYYWTNIPGVEQPKDKGITTKDIFDYSGELAHECRVKWLTNESGKKSVAYNSHICAMRK